MPVSYLIPGMRLSRPVFGPFGELLLGRGVELTSQYIFALKRCNILAVHVETPGKIDENEVEEALGTQVQIEAMNQVRLWAQSGERNRTTFTASVVKVVETIISEIVSGKTCVSGLAEIISADAYTFAHSVDVCVWAVTAGCKLKYDRQTLLRLGVGSLLHDLGKSKVPGEILNKPGKLTPAEYEEVKKHPLWSYRMLRFEAEDKIDPVSAAITLDHHERFDGSGYPRGIKGQEISEMAGLCAIADVWSAMTTDRVYRPALPRQEVYEMLMGSGGVMFDFGIAKTFLSCVQPYPVGTLVWLSTGDLANVVQVKEAFPFRPTVLVVATGEVIDLCKELSVTIISQISPDKARAIAAGSTAEGTEVVGVGAYRVASAYGA